MSFRLSWSVQSSRHLFCPSSFSNTWKILIKIYQQSKHVTWAGYSKFLMTENIQTHSGHTQKNVDIPYGLCGRHCSFCHWTATVLTKINCSSNSEIGQKNISKLVHYHMLSIVPLVDSTIWTCNPRLSLRINHYFNYNRWACDLRWCYPRKGEGICFIFT